MGPTLLRGLALACLFAGSAVFAVPTEITVRVIARDAQYVGDLVDGAFVTIADGTTGEVLAQGVTRGDAGDPKRIMQTPRKRGAPFAAREDAGFSATLDIAEPRYLQVTATGPLDERYAANRVSATQWVVPGKHLSGGDGWVLELPGLIVAPSVARNTVSLTEAEGGVLVEAEVMLMCGCPIREDFHWDVDEYEVVAILRRGDTEVGQFPLRYSGAASEFETRVRMSLPGVYEVLVYAYDETTGNTGVGRLELTVSGG